VSIGKGFDVHLEGLRITGGDARVGSNSPDGGGIHNEIGSLSITGCEVEQNHASRGGGIFNLDGNVLITNSNVRGNVADLLGGGIHNSFKRITLGSGAIITDNQAADPDSAAESGGGIFNEDGTVIRETGSSVTLNRPDDCKDLGELACGCETPCP
jgi:hypothetical protein